MTSNNKIYLYKKLFFVFIPKIWLLALIISILVLQFDSTLSILSYTVLNFAFLYFSLKISLVLHELGHWLGARMVKEYPRRMVWGSRHEVLKTNFFKTKLTIYDKLESGYVLTVFANRKNYRLRYSFYVFMGPLTNLLLAIAFIYIFPFSIKLSETICIGFIGTLINSLIFLTSMYPRYIKINGIDLKSDGLNLWNIVLNKNKSITEDQLAINDFLDAEDTLKEKDYRKAITQFTAVATKFEENSQNYYACQLNIAVCKGELGEIAEFHQITKQIVEELGEAIPQSFKMIVYGNLALTNLLMKDLAQAEHYINLALKQTTDKEEIINLLAAIYIDKGMYERGIEHLVSNVDLSYPNSNTLFASMYLYKGYSALGSIKKAQKYKDFVLAQEEQLKGLDKYIWQSIQGEA